MKTAEMGETAQYNSQIHPLQRNKKLAEATMKIGYAYFTGEGVEQNHESAFEWYFKAAEKGEPIAQAMVGNLYEFGTEGIAVDLVQAMHWYQKSDVQISGGTSDAIERLRRIRCSSCSRW